MRRQRLGLLDDAPDAAGEVEADDEAADRGEAPATAAPVKSSTVSCRAWSLESSLTKGRARYSRRRPLSAADTAMSSEKTT